MALLKLAQKGHVPLDADINRSLNLARFIIEIQTALRGRQGRMLSRALAQVFRHGRVRAPSLELQLAYLLTSA